MSVVTLSRDMASVDDQHVVAVVYDDFRHGGNGNGAASSGDIAAKASAFDHITADDSQHEPPDFRTPGDDFGA